MKLKWKEEESEKQFYVSLQPFNFYSIVKSNTIKSITIIQFIFKQH